MLIPGAWDMVIAFPPCTDLSCAGAKYWAEKLADGRTHAARDFFLLFWDAAPLVAIENPAGWMNTNWRKPTQTIHPYHFGDPYMKRTCLWLKGLPDLVPTNVVEPVAHWVGGQRRRKPSELPGLHRNPSSRSLTFPGIADAMAIQWTGADLMQPQMPGSPRVRP